ncbi:MAG: hypothetical protein IJZ90_03640 [Clostridia bacterium]|nr:hypothetical protein [Clostridia bacterium]
MRKIFIIVGICIVIIPIFIVLISDLYFTDTAGFGLICSSLLLFEAASVLSIVIKRKEKQPIYKEIGIAFGLLLALILFVI